LSLGAQNSAICRVQLTIFHIYIKKRKAHTLSFTGGDKIYVIGEPVVSMVDLGRDDFLFPAGQIKTCQGVLRSFKGMIRVIETLKREYLAIAYELEKMDVQFRIVHSHPAEIDRGLLSLCLNQLDCGFMDLGNISPPLSMFPRNYCAVLHNIRYLLLSNDIAGKINIRKNGWQLLTSEYGDGARVLSQGDTAIICDRLTQKGESLDGGHLDIIKKAGMRVARFPPMLISRFSKSRNKPVSFAYNDHLDRGACFIKGRDDKLYLVVDPALVTADWEKPTDGCLWQYRSAQDTKEYLKRIMDPLGVTVCWPKKIEVPYALNLVQFPDGKVLMTGGDRGVRALIAGIVGEKNVFVTPIPIRCYPVWLYGGIGCLIGEIPDSLLTSSGGTHRPIWF